MKKSAESEVTPHTEALNQTIVDQATRLLQGHELDSADEAEREILTKEVEYEKHKK